MLKSLTARAIVPVAVAVTGFVVVCCILLFSALKTDMISDAVSYETETCRHYHQIYTLRHVERR